MRSLLLLILFGYFMIFAASRPSGAEERNGDRDTEENEYENGGEEAIEDDTVQEDEDNSAARFSDSKSSQYNYPLDEKPKADPDREFQSSLVHRNMQTNEETNNRLKNDVQDSDQDLITMKRSDNKKMTASEDESNEEGDLLFENNENRNGQMNTIDTNSYNNEQVDSNTQASLFNKKQYSNMKIDHRETEEGRKYSGRDRREIEESQQKDDLSSNENEDLDNNEDEEAAIRKHVKKLSGAELEELLNSLSGDKRVLLKKIMENDPANTRDSINKREITKKAGAAEENIESVLLDSSKLQSGSEGTASPSSVGSSSDSSKSQDPQTEILTSKGFEIPSSSTEAANKAEPTISDSQGLSSSATLEESKIQVNANSLSPVNTKAEIKREVNVDDLANYEMETNFKDSEYLDNDQYMCVNDNNLSDEPQMDNKNDNMYKRDVNSAADIKSLEESFPNSNKYDDRDPYAGSDMVPLIRVKRRNEDISVKKRAAALLPDAKVAFFPYRAESDDVDTEESNEFDDDRFYDRSSNLGNKYVSEKNIENIESPSRYLQSKNIQSNVVSQSKVESDTNNLGSDTDNVLSGVEGVDENLMLNSGLRDRRTIDGNLKMGKQPQKNLNKRLTREFESTTLKDNDNTSPSENYMSVSNYQENDAFGPLPRNYESELNRFKRIRHVQPPAFQETAPKT